MKKKNELTDEGFRKPGGRAEEDLKRTDAATLKETVS